MNDVCSDDLVSTPAGISFGLMYLPSIVIVGYYFDKKRAFATGLAVCGSGIGTFLFAPLSKMTLVSTINDRLHGFLNMYMQITKCKFS